LPSGVRAGLGLFAVLLAIAVITFALVAPQVFVKVFGGD
jgi:hypothetical protein